MLQKIFSPGKLLITSEYLVLDGALALAVCSKYGQYLFAEEKENGENLIFWEAYHENKLWLRAKIDHQKWKVLDTNAIEPADFISKVLMKIQILSREKIRKGTTYFLKTLLNFPENYGLGSSSTLVNNLSQWAGVDPFIINEQCFGGSGYDIAVARERDSILFQKTEKEILIEKIYFKPSFSSELVLVHLNKKQNSRKSILQYRRKRITQKTLDFFSNLSQEVLFCKNLQDFSYLMDLHEKTLSPILDMPCVKEKYFADCPSFVKSLGAWGGDFVLTSKFIGYKEYFIQKGFQTIFDFHDLIS